MSPSTLEIEQFHEQGYLVREDLVPPEWLRQIREELAGLHERMAREAPPDVHVSWESDVDPAFQGRIKQLMHAERVSPTIDRLLRADHVLESVETLIEKPFASYSEGDPWLQPRGGIRPPNS